jgi:hypothetical protein
VSNRQETEQAKQPVQVLIRLWHARSGGHSEVHDETGSRAQMLVDDVLSSTLEATAVHRQEGYVSASGINHLGQILAASRALQEAFEGFRATSPSAKTTVSVVLDRPLPGESDTRPSSPSLELTSLLGITRPGQVLITQSFYKFLDGCQPLQLRSFPARAGAYEWLWTSGERLNQLQSDPDFRPTVVGEPRTVAKAAAIVQPRPASMVQGAPTVEAAETGSKRFHIGNLRPRYKVAAAVALAVAVGAGAALWTVDRPRQTKPTVLSDPRIRTLEKVPVSKKLETEIDSLGSEAANIHPSAPQIFTPPARVFDPPPPKPRQGCSIADSITAYLALAERNRNQGEYDAAIREYNQVLACDPGNRTARSGLARTLEQKQVNPSR